MDDAKKCPHESKGCLDKDVLRKSGLTKHRMVVQDPILFYQLIVPVCDVNKSCIVDDPRQNNFSDVETFSARYAFET